MHISIKFFMDSFLIKLTMESHVMKTPASNNFSSTFSKLLQISCVELHIYIYTKSCKKYVGIFGLLFNHVSTLHQHATLLLLVRYYLVLINWAGGLYGRILTEVASTDRTQRGLYQRPRSRFSHTDRPSSVNKMFIIWPNKNNLIRLM